MGIFAILLYEIKFQWQKSRKSNLKIARGFQIRRRDINYGCNLMPITYIYEWLVGFNLLV